MTAKKCTTKSVMHVQIWCFATINLLLFGLSSCRRRPLGSLLKSLSNDDGDGNLNVIKGFRMCIRHTSDTFLTVTALLRSSQSIWKKLPYFGSFMEDVSTRRRYSPFFLMKLERGRYCPFEYNSNKFVQDLKHRGEITAIKFETARVQFFNYVVASVAVWLLRLTLLVLNTL